MNARDEAVEMIRRICPPHLSADEYGQILAEKFDVHRTETLAEVTTWLTKKAREFRADGQRQHADLASSLASKVARGAVRPDNLRMLAGTDEVPAADGATAEAWPGELGYLRALITSLTKAVEAENFQAAQRLLAVYQHNHGQPAGAEAAR